MTPYGSIALVRNATTRLAFDVMRFLLSGGGGWQARALVLDLALQHRNLVQLGGTSWSN